MEYIEESKDKNGKIDIKRLSLKLIDAYKISASAAKILMGYKLHETKNVRAEAERIITGLQNGRRNKSRIYGQGKD